MNLNRIEKIKIEMEGKHFRAILRTFENEDIIYSYEELIPLRIKNNDRFNNPDLKDLLLKSIKNEKETLEFIRVLIEKYSILENVKTDSSIDESPEKWVTIYSNWTLLDMLEGDIGFVINTHKCKIWMKSLKYKNG